MVAPSEGVAKSLDKIPGWLSYTDQLLMEWILRWQAENEPVGDLVELGVYQGKSAIHIGRFKRPEEKFTVCDLFEEARGEHSIRADARKTYSNLTQDVFERNYRSFHDELPNVLRGLSEIIVDRVAHGSCRFVHIDASHMYEHVKTDSNSARKLLRTNGVVVFDDYRTEHTIGTAAAVWEAVVNHGLHPICVSSMKLYGTWGDPGPLQQEIVRRLSERSDHRAEFNPVLDQTIVRVIHVKPAPAKSPPQPAESAEVKALREEVRNLSNIVGQLSQAMPTQ